MTKVPKVLQRPATDPFWKSNVQRGNVAPTLQDVLDKIDTLERKLDALLEAQGIEVSDDNDTAPSDGGWVKNR